MMSDNKMRILLMMMMALAAMALTGCGDDDPAAPGGGGGGTTGDDFDQATAVAQAQVASPQAIAMVESIESMTAGVGKTGYAYNPTTQRWEYNLDAEVNGYTYDWFYTVQYRDDTDTPQQSATGAASIRHTLAGSGEYALVQDGTSFDYDFVYAYDVTITGLGTTTYNMTGSGSTDIDYTYTYQNSTQSADFVMNWATLSPGVSIPQGGCPTGTIRYDMAPYHLDVVFNGSGTATSTLYDSGNSVVAGGGGTEQMYCGMGR